jgi:hypothetical protein
MGGASDRIPFCQRNGRSRVDEVWIWMIGGLWGKMGWLEWAIDCRFNNSSRK